MSRPNNLQLIADDYGLGGLHNQAIRELLALDAISGTSVIIELCDADSAQALINVKQSHQQIGLHFNLTQPTALHPVAYYRNQLLLSLPFGFNQSLCVDRLKEQWQLFIDLFGFEPHYIDGHEHVHQFIGVQKAVAQFAAEKGVPVRSTRLLGPVSGLKNHVINFLGRSFQKTAKRYSVVTNNYFCGVLPLDNPAEAEVELKLQLQQAFSFAEAHPDKTLTMMVHPGSVEDATQVKGHAAEMRSIEYRVLKALASSRGL
jgi:predicted glycoside hydrolase/deacetylase ChbG (UPF0249 family)